MPLKVAAKMSNSQLANTEQQRPQLLADKLYHLMSYSEDKANSQKNHKMNDLELEYVGLETGKIEISFTFDPSQIIFDDAER